MKSFDGRAMRLDRAPQSDRLPARGRLIGRLLAGLLSTLWSHGCLGSGHLKKVCSLAPQVSVPTMLAMMMGMMGQIKSAALKCTLQVTKTAISTLSAIGSDVRNQTTQGSRVLGAVLGVYRSVGNLKTLRHLTERSLSLILHPDIRARDGRSRLR